jgi:subtilisin family serine protease
VIDPPPVGAAFLSELTGAGIQIAIVDSGVNFQHPHLAVMGKALSIVREDGGISLRRDRGEDRFGHGTCCAALLHALAPDAALFAIRVIHDRPSTDAELLARGIRAAAEEGAHVICAPSGTRSPLGAALDEAVLEATSTGAWVVAPIPSPDVRPGTSPRAVGVGLLDGVDVALEGERIVADGRPRPSASPRNFYGPSLSAARAAAALARWLERSADRGWSEERFQSFKSSLPLR